MNIKIENMDRTKIVVKCRYDKKMDTYTIFVFPKVKIKKEIQTIVGWKKE
jgi:hypothetical protein